MNFKFFLIFLKRQIKFLCKGLKNSVILNPICCRKYFQFFGNRNSNYLVLIQQVIQFNYQNFDNRDNGAIIF